MCRQHQCRQHQRHVYCSSRDPCLAHDPRRWFKHVALEQVRVIFIPICRNLHWTLAVVLHRSLLKRALRSRLRPPPSPGAAAPASSDATPSKPRAGTCPFKRREGGGGGCQHQDEYKHLLLYLDPLGARPSSSTPGLPPAPASILEPIDAFFRHECLVRACSGGKAGEKMGPGGGRGGVVGVEVQVPRQENGHDCGVFVLRYLERFVSVCVLLSAAGDHHTRMQEHARAHTRTRMCVQHRDRPAAMHTHRFLREFVPRDDSASELQRCRKDVAKWVVG